MKKLFPLVSLVIFVFLGAGCAATSSITSQEEIQPVVSEVPWRLSFTLPDDWIITEGCVLGDRQVSCGYGIANNTLVDMIPTLDRDVNPDAPSIILQNTDKITLFGGIGPDQDLEDYYQTERIANIVVTRLPQATDIASITGIKKEEVVPGFTKVTTCDLATTPECEIYGQKSHVYYYQSDSGDMYQFTITSMGVDEKVMENIILSAHTSTQ